MWNFWKLPLPDIEDELKRLAKAIDLSRPTFDTFGSDKLNIMMILLQLMV